MHGTTDTLVAMAVVAFVVNSAALAASDPVRAGSICARSAHWREPRRGRIAWDAWSSGTAGCALDKPSSRCRDEIRSY